MGRPPCYDKVGVKKGPWAPEEDIMLVSYVQEHGPGNWRAVPNITGLRRCSKSCRLRWTNYLRPGIKRGSFSDHEEKMIIQLQALLGNKWAAIASYLPDRTDNDIKNYWNTHLKKKLKRVKTDESSSAAAPSSSSFSRGQWERRLQTDIKTAKQALEDALSSENHITQLFKSPATAAPTAKTTSCYASSTENISRLLKQWEKNKPKSQDSGCSSTQNSSNNPTAAMDSSCSEETPTTKIKTEKAAAAVAKVDCCVIQQPSDILRSSGSPVDIKPDPATLAPLSMLESWLLEDQGKDYFSLDGNSGLF